MERGRQRKTASGHVAVAVVLEERKRMLANRNLRLKNIVLATAVSAALAYGETAHAAPILDQQYVGFNGLGSVNIQPTQAITQIFTVGIDGILSSVEVRLARDSNPVPTQGLTLSIIDAPGGTPNFSSVLASAFISASSVTGAFTFVPVDLSAASLSVTVGQRLGIYLTTTAPVSTGGGINPYGWFADLPGVYAGGDSFVNTTRHTTRDYAFRTFVDPQAPEPAMLALIGAGLFGTALRRRRR
jgi:hypothetical protein